MASSHNIAGSTENPFVHIEAIPDETGEYEWRTDRQYFPVHENRVKDFISDFRSLMDLEKIAFDTTKNYGEETRSLIGRGLGALATDDAFVEVVAIGPTDGLYHIELPLIQGVQHGQA